jgi:hypothetical protein
MVNIKVNVTKKLDNLDRLTRNIQKAYLSKNAAEVLATRIKQTINQRSSYPSGTLINSIKTYKVSNRNYGIKAAYYYWNANYGRGPGTPPSNKVIKVDVWAKKAGMRGKTLRRHIAEFGTRKLLFHEAAKQLFKADKPRIYKEIFK